jgi:GNAT superfamily N-acetyltransferase
VDSNGCENRVNLNKMIHISPLTVNDLPAAASLFTQKFKELRDQIPILPASLEDPSQVIRRMEHLLSKAPVYAATQNGQLVGYLGGYIINHFRDGDRRGAYCPEWAHAVVPENIPVVVPALYRSASGAWTDAGVSVHAITLLANDHIGRETWFWNGFGLSVVNAVREMQPFLAHLNSSFEIRPADSDDAQILADLDEEHSQHYSNPPVFMPKRAPIDNEGFKHFLGNSRNSVWLALHNNHPAGFIQFEGSSFGAAEIVNATDSLAITGAYVRPEHRGQGVAALILNEALKANAFPKYARCSVDFESFNPEAAAFWKKYFQPVCFSLMRIPEHLVLRS